MYNPNAPQNNPPLIEQPKIKTNFSVFSDAILNNHEPMNDPNQGNHKNVIMKVQASIPPVIQNVGTLFCKSVANGIGTTNQIFYSNFPIIDGNINPKNVNQLTYNQIIYSGSQQQTFIFGGYVIFIGKIAVVASSSITVTLSPTISSIISVSGLLESGLPIKSASVTSATIVVFSLIGVSTGTLDYFIIGRA